MSSKVTIRQATTEDVERSGRICFEAFSAIANQHGFEPDLPSAEAGVGVVGWMFSNPLFYCVVAESAGQVMGSNCLDERNSIAGVGPITVDPAVQNGGVGGKLMEAVLERARERRFAGVRLVQAAYHGRSLSLYSKLGFDIREPLSVMQGPPMRKSIDGCRIRPAREDDLKDASGLCERVHGISRAGELLDAIRQGAAIVVERHGRLTGYSTGLGFFGHTVGEANLDVQALICSADSFSGPGLLMPSRNSELFRWCLANGLRVQQPMTLMTMGFYNEPAGAYLPSIAY